MSSADLSLRQRPRRQHALPAALTDHVIDDSRGLAGARSPSQSPGPDLAAEGTPTSQQALDVGYGRQADASSGYSTPSDGYATPQARSSQVTGRSARRQNRILQEQLEELRERLAVAEKQQGHSRAARSASPSTLPWLEEAVVRWQQQQQQRKDQGPEDHLQCADEDPQLVSALEELQDLQRSVDQHKQELETRAAARQAAAAGQEAAVQLRKVHAKQAELRQELQELQRQQQLLESGPAPLRPCSTAAAPSSAVADEDSIRAQLAAQMRLLGRADAGLAVSAAQIGELTNSNLSKLQPAAHAAAKALLEQEAAAGARGLGMLPPGEAGGTPVAGTGFASASSSAAAQQQVLDAVDRLGSTYRAGGCRTGAYGQQGMPLPLSPFTPQSYATFNRGGLTAAVVCLDASGKQHYQLQHTQLTADPSKLAKLMDSSQKFAAAQRACLRDMAKAGYVTADSIPKWEVFWCAWERLAEVFSQRGNWGGFLAANHKAWLAMYERGLPPDADYGRVDFLELLPYMSWQPFSGAASTHSNSGGSGGGGSGGGGSGSGSGGSGAGGSKGSSELCRLFQKGECTRGAACRFKH